MKASMTMVPKAPIHQICLPSISIHHFDQSKSKGLRFVPQRNPNSYVHHNALLMKQPQPMVKYNQGKFFNSSFHAYLNLFECPQSSIHQDMSCGLEKLISQFIWLFWNALRPNFLCVGQMEMIPNAKMFLRTMWTTFMFIKNWFEAWKVIIHSKTL